MLILCRKVGEQAEQVGTSVLEMLNPAAITPVATANSAGSPAGNCRSVRRGNGRRPGKCSRLGS